VSTTTATPIEGLPPGPSLPRALQTAGFILRGPSYLKKLQAEHGDVFTMRITGEGRWVILADPAHIKQVFTGSPDVFHAGKGNQVLLPLLGDHSVLLLDGPEHLRQRRLLLPPFHGQRMTAYGELMDEITAEEVARWPVGEDFASWPRMQHITLEVIMRAVFGVEQGPQLDRVRTALNRLLDEVMRPTTMAVLSAIGPHRFRELAIVKRELARADAEIYPVIRERRAAPDLEDRQDILSLLLQARHEDGRPMSDEELRDELMTLLVAGHETTATTLGWAVERLTRHPDALARATAEVREQGADGPFLDGVVKETLRLRPVLSVVVRQLQEDAEVAGYRLPAGTRVVPCIQLAHRRPDVYPDPDAFRPERWLDQQPGTYSWLPFGGGVRRCLGASFALFEAKRVLAGILGQVDLAPAARDGEQVRRRAITQTPQHGARITVAARHDRRPVQEPVAVPA
jgi:cytochrome P450